MEKDIKSQLPYCPQCYSTRVWRFGKRRVTNIIVRRFRCLTCKYVWEIEEPIIQIKSIPPTIQEIFFNLIKKRIVDAEKNLPIEERGWEKVNPSEERTLLSTGMCEKNEKTGEIRVKNLTELPADILLHNDAKTFVEICKAERIVQELEKKWKGPERYKEIVKGIKRLLESGLDAVSPRYFFKIKNDLGSKIELFEWYMVAHKAIDFLVLQACEMIWGKNSPLTKVAYKILNLQPLTSETESKIDEVRKILKWEEVIRKLGKENLEALGFLWAADEYLKEVENPLANKIARIDVLNLIGDKYLENIDNKIEEIASELEVEYIYLPW
jgi:hypothetical protein